MSSIGPSSGPATSRAGRGPFKAWWARAWTSPRRRRWPGSWWTMQTDNLAFPKLLGHPHDRPMRFKPAPWRPTARTKRREIGGRVFFMYEHEHDDGLTAWSDAPRLCPCGRQAASAYHDYCGKSINSAIPAGK